MDWNTNTTLYVIGKLTYEEMFNGLEIAIHQFAKRQMTWFRGMERRGFTIHWMNAELPMEEKIAFVKRNCKGISIFGSYYSAIFNTQ